MHVLTIVGLLFNSILIVFKRSIRRLGWWYTVGLFAGVALMLAGLILSRT